MTGYSIHGDLDLETRRRRLVFRAWHRGIKELDLLFGNYVDRHINSFSHDDCQWFEAIFEENDQQVLSWIMGNEPVPAAFDHPHFSGVCAQDGRALKTR